MGWMYTRDRIRTKQEMDRFFVREFASITLVKSALVGATWYAAVRRNDEVFGVVCLTKRNARAADGYTFGYKDMDETMGPYESKCPLRVLDQLSPTTNDSALRWRQRCRDYYAKGRLTLQVGQRVRTQHPVTFGGTPQQEFTVEQHRTRGKRKQLLFRAPDGMLCRVPRAWLEVAV